MKFVKSLSFYESELRALAAVLNQILSGERQPDLSGLIPPLQEVVQAMLATI